MVPLQDKLVVGRGCPRRLHNSRTVVGMKLLAVLEVVVDHLDDAEPVDPLDPLQAVAVEQDVDHFTHCRLVRDEQTLVLRLSHQDRVVDSNQATLAHLEREPAIAPRVARLEFGWPGVVIQNQGSGVFGFGPSGGQVVRLDPDLHGQVEELRIPVPHLVLAEQHPDDLGGCCPVADAESFVLDVGSKAASVDLDRGHLRVEVGQVEAGEARGPRGHRERLVGARVERGPSKVGRLLTDEKVLSAAHRLTVRLARVVQVVVVVVQVAREVATRPPGLVVGSGLAMFQHLGDHFLSTDCQRNVIQLHSNLWTKTFF